MRTETLLRICLSSAVLMGLLAFDPIACAGTCGIPPPPPPVPGQRIPELTVRDRAQLRVDKAARILEGLGERQDARPGTPIPEGVASTPSQGVTVTVRFLRRYRGVSPEALTILAAMGNGDGGVEFETGQPYLIFANLLDSGQTFTSIRAGTEVLSRSEPAVRLLRGEPPVPDDRLSVQDYYDEMVPLWTESVGGRVTNALAGSPVRGADGPPGQPSDGPFHRKRIPTRTVQLSTAGSALPLTLDRICRLRKGTTLTPERG